MTRLEIIMDRTIEDIFLERLHKEISDCPYTLVSEAKGFGKSGPRMGTHVWPEENSLLFIYADEVQAEIIRTILEQIRNEHPANGLTAFAMEQAREILL